MDQAESPTGGAQRGGGPRVQERKGSESPVLRKVWGKERFTPGFRKWEQYRIQDALEQQPPRVVGLRRVEIQPSLSSPNP